MILLDSSYYYILLVISFTQYKKYMICLTSFSKLSDALPGYTCLVVDILSLSHELIYI